MGMLSDGPNVPGVAGFVFGEHEVPGVPLGIRFIGHDVFFDPRFLGFFLLKKKAHVLCQTCALLVSFFSRVFYVYWFLCRRSHLWGYVCCRQ